MDEGGGVPSTHSSCWSLLGGAELNRPCTFVTTSSFSFALLKVVNSFSSTLSSGMFSLSSSTPADLSSFFSSTCGEISSKTSERESSKRSSASSSSAKVSESLQSQNRFLETGFVHRSQKLFSLNKLNLSWLNHSIFLVELKAVVFADQLMMRPPSLMAKA